jgi:bifunctional DNA-binding transcriptional regulator/antitoxin component of YhaV-PrlF toxin-antitoxin module
MLVDFTDYDKIPEMWMKDTTVALDMIGLDEDGKVTQVYTPKPESEELIPFPNAKYVLEVNAESGIKIGDDYEIDEDEDLDKYVMKVLDKDGAAQMLLQGSERIFSRKSTRMMIVKAKKAFAVRNDKEAYEKAARNLGDYVLKELWAQDHRAPEYVNLPEKQNKESEDSKS